MNYCTAEQVDIGNIMLPRGFNKQYFIDQASDEMEAELGKTYKLPLTLSVTHDENGNAIANPLDDPNSWISKLLNKINRYLAIGRIVISAASGGEDNSLNSYGYYHIKQANDALASLVNRTIELPFQLADINADKLPSGPSVDNREAASFVDSFYQQSVGNAPVSNQVYPNNAMRSHFGW